MAFPSLGYFSDPVWPALLELSDEELIELLLHELTHRTVYVPNQTPFNETLANFIGRVGTRDYLAHRYGHESKQIKDFEEHQKQQAIYFHFFNKLYEKLDPIYKSNISPDQKRAKKLSELEKAKSDYLQLHLPDSLKTKNWSSVNNAYLLSFKRYNYDENIFAQLLMAVHGDFNRFFEEVMLIGLEARPFEALPERVRKILGK